MSRHDERVPVSLVADPASTDVRGGSDWSHDVLLSAGPGPDRPGRWSRWSARRRRSAAAAVLLPALALLAVPAVGRVQAWQDERALRDRVSVAADLGVDASSWAWSPSGRGRVEYFLVLRNHAPRPARMTEVRIEHGGLSISGRPVRRAPVPPGGVAYVPLDVQLDCRQWRPGVRGPALRGHVGVVAASGRSSQVSIPVDRAGPLTGVVRTLCGLDPDLRIADMSGPLLLPR